MYTMELSDVEVAVVLLCRQGFADYMIDNACGGDGVYPSQEEIDEFKTK